MMVSKDQNPFRLGMILNPLAGLGGPAGLKGSDHPDTVTLAAQRGVKSKVQERTRDVLQGISNLASPIHIVTASGAMGATVCEDLGASFTIEIVYEAPEITSAQDTFLAAQAICAQQVDLLLFVGGDGTARDIYRAIREHQAVLGLPAGVKMHSGVFAVTPKAVVSVIASLLDRKLVAARLAEVRDIDEQAFALGKVSTRHYGEMLVPDDQLLVQAVKCSGLFDDEIMLQELCAYMAEEMEDGTLYILGSGGTLKRLKSEIGITDPTLLGVDVWFDGSLLAKDVHEQQLFDLIQSYPHCQLILSIIGGQGIILGRGNQQISPRIIDYVGLDNLQFITTQQKILALEGRPLRIDSGSDELDRRLSGFHKIICGYEDALLYEVRYLE